MALPASAGWCSIAVMAPEQHNGNVETVIAGGIYSHTDQATGHVTFRWACDKCPSAGRYDDLNDTVDSLVAHHAEHHAVTAPHRTDATAADDSEPGWTPAATAATAADGEPGWTLADQLLHLWPHIPEAASMLLGHLPEGLRNKAMERSSERILDGYDEYDDALFTASYEAVYNDLVDELADATIYAARILSMRASVHTHR